MATSEGNNVVWGLFDRPFKVGRLDEPSENPDVGCYSSFCGGCEKIKIFREGICEACGFSEA